MNKKKKALISIAAGMAAAILLGLGGDFNTPRLQPPASYAGAWWGYLYPRFCFAPDGEKKEEKPQFSFWVAKALDWW